VLVLELTFDDESRSLRVLRSVWCCGLSDDDVLSVESEAVRSLSVLSERTDNKSVSGSSDSF